MKQEIYELVCAKLAKEMPFLPLRGTDALAREGGDLDFMVPPGHALSACKLVALEARDSGWYLAALCDIGYLAQIVLIRPGTQGKDEAIKIDFFDGLRWYGAGTDAAGHRLFFAAAPSSGDSAKLAGVAGFLQKTMTVGQVSDRDWARLQTAGVDNAYLDEMAKILGLPLTLQQIEARGVSGIGKWKLRAASGNATGPFSLGIWFWQVTFCHLKFRIGLGTKAGMAMGISGLDGSGKSTLVDRLIAAYRKSGSNVPELVHLLPSWIPMPHQILRRKKTQSNYTRPYAEKPVSSKVSAGLRLTYYLLSFILAKLAMQVSIWRGKSIILDRSFLDFSSDLTRARIPAYRLPKFLLRRLIPPGRLYFLDAGAETVVNRKGELTLDKATELKASYLATCSIVGATLLDGDKSADRVFVEFLEYLHEDRVRVLMECSPNL